MFRARTALVVGVVLSLALAGPAAAFSQSAGVTDSLTVNEVVSLTLDTTGVVYQKKDGGSLDPGMTSMAQGIKVTVVANRAWDLKVTGTDLWSGEGNMIPATARFFETPEAPFSQGMTVLTGTGSDVQNIYIGIKVPAAQQGGGYAGTLTFTLTAP